MSKTILAACVCSALTATVVVLIVTSLSKEDGLKKEDVVDHSSTIEAMEAEIAALKEAQSNQKKSVNLRFDELNVSLNTLASELREAKLASSNSVASGGSRASAEDEGVAEQLSDDEFVEQTVDALVSDRMSFDEMVKHWKELDRRGLTDQALSEIEAFAKANPNDADAQALLGGSYIQKLLTVNDVEKGPWSMRADAAYNRALAIDEQHWGARFSKAMNYSFNPPVMGLQPKAIEQFEILRGQQEQREQKPQYAQTYLLLGNLYANQGKAEKAQETWKRGLEFFPDDGQLASKAKDVKPATE